MPGQQLKLGQEGHVGASAWRGGTRFSSSCGSCHFTCDRRVRTQTEDDVVKVLAGAAAGKGLSESVQPPKLCVWGFGLFGPEGRPGAGDI